jgi:hypothetical protein
MRAFPLAEIARELEGGAPVTPWLEGSQELAPSGEVLDVANCA